MHFEQSELKKGGIMKNVWYLVLGLFVAVQSVIAADTVYLNIGDDFQNAVNAKPGATVFKIKAGIHRLQDVTPKSNNVFVGEDGAIMSGARLLTNWVQEGGYWVHGGQNQSISGGGECADGYPRCTYPEDLYMDNKIMKHVASQGEVTSGTFFFDYAGDRIYIKDNPAGHTMEVCTARRAFGGSATNVLIKNLIVEKYAIPGQKGAIGDNREHKGWTIESCEVRYNHAVGIAISDRSIVRDCYMHHNGQMGICAKGIGGLIEENEISYNNTAGYKWGWEAGGSKFAYCESLTVRNNYVHHNFGPGLWTDIDNYHTLYEGNVVDSNQSMGIFHEISWDAIIRCNIVRNNSYAQHNWLYGGQILLSASQNCEVYNNTLVVNARDGHGLTIINQARGGSRYARNNYIHHNDVTHKGNMGENGAATDYDVANFWANGNNRFDYNTYHVPDSTQTRWTWRDAARNWSAFRAQSQEAHGKVDYNLNYTPDFPACGTKPGVRPEDNRSQIFVIQKELTLALNPASRQIVVQSVKPIQSLLLCDVAGRTIRADVDMLRNGYSAVVAYGADLSGVFFMRTTVGGQQMVNRFLMVK